ncbi:hydroxyacid dehydrogenase (plasmid) [Glaciihabitans sp. INWT7]|uniref:hydroxyacid dehydrogenase n=1 Tax=Glaciihabitans sp. INWT7 TaxID=2596912 RepID=UPI001624BD2F|nr:hydroxyacid dehydrogenase [Glaciihabitans sp. INWT7]QNE48635.1 hydroxyacid dehydrogenase [Glaciihabitans sp. INWT7]
MSAPLDIILDIPPRLEAMFFDDDLQTRLRSVGIVRRVDYRVGDNDPRMSAEVVVTGWGSRRLPDHLESSDRLRFVAHSAGTIREFVPRSLIDDGVLVSQAAFGMATSVAELALVFTITLLRNLHLTTRLMEASHDWSAAASITAGPALAGSRVGVVGASRVGRAYIDLVRAAGAEVVVYDPYLDLESAARLGVTLSDLDDLLASCRVVAVHAPVTPETRHLLDRRRLSLICDGGVLVNTARSAIVDIEALTDELVTGRLSAGLDVFDEEPLPSTNRLWGLPNVILTPHVGGITRHAQHLQGLIVVEEIERLAAGRPLEFTVPSDRYDILA